MKPAIIFLFVPLTVLPAEPQTAWERYQQAHETAERWRQKAREDARDRKLDELLRIERQREYDRKRRTKPRR